MLHHFHDYPLEHQLLFYLPIEDVCTDWVKKNPKVAKEHKIDEILADHQKTKKSDTKQTRLQAWRVATMGRLSELGVISWKIDAHSQSSYSLGPNSDVLYIKDLSGSDCFIPKPARPGNSSNRLYSFPYLGSVLPSKLLPILVNCL